MQAHNWRQKEQGQFYKPETISSSDSLWFSEEEELYMYMLNLLCQTLCRDKESRASLQDMLGHPIDLNKRDSLYMLFINSSRFAIFSNQFFLSLFSFVG